MIPHNRPTLGEGEQQAVQRVLASGWLAQGAEVAAFEDEMCSFLGLPQGHAAAVANGSAALYLALQATKQGARRIAAPAYSCRSIWNAIQLAGCDADWRDTLPDSPLADLGKEAAGAPRLAIAAHMFGLPLRLPAGGTVVEDCSQALGARVDGAMVGTIGDAGVFSFGATKPITSAGHGGMVVSRHRAVVDFVRQARDYDTVMDGTARFNFQMTDVEASVGRVQLGRWPEFAARRQEIHEVYRQAGLPLLQTGDTGARAFRFRAVLLTPRAQDIQHRLLAHGIQAIVPVRADELLAPADRLPNAASLCARTLSLPIYPSLRLEDAATIARICSECLH